MLCGAFAFFLPNHLKKLAHKFLQKPHGNFQKWSVLGVNHDNGEVNSFDRRLPGSFLYKKEPGDKARLSPQWQTVFVLS